MQYRFFVCCLAVFSQFSNAEDIFEDFHKYAEATLVKDEHAREFYGDVEVGLIVSTGNTNASSAKLKSNLYYNVKEWRNQFKFDSLFKKDSLDDSNEDVTTANRVFVSGQGNYLLNDDASSFFIYSDLEFDKFSGFDSKASFASGYGNRLFTGRKNTVDIDVGPGVSYSRTEEGQTETGFLLRLALEWHRTVSKRTRFTQELSLEKSLSGLTSRLKSETALISQINNALALKFSYLYRYNSTPEDGKRAYDSETSATLVYSFQ